MENLESVERSAMEMLLAGEHPALPVLRDQLRNCRVLRRERHGDAGYYAFLWVPEEVESAQLKGKVLLSGVSADVPELEGGGIFVLEVLDGRLKLLDLTTFDETWPVHVTEFKLCYLGGSKRLGDPERRG